MTHISSTSAFPSLSRVNSGKLYQQLAEVLMKTIADGGYRKGEEFPSESEITSRYKVSRATVRHALQILEDEGFIFRQPGKATMVTRTQPVIDAGHRVGRLAEELQQLGLKVRSRHYDFQEVAPPRESLERMNVHCDLERVFSFKHQLYGNDHLISYAINYVLTEPERITLNEVELEARSFYDILAQDYSLEIINAEQTIGADPASIELAKMFRLPPGAPLLVTETVAYTKTGQKALYAIVWYDPTRFRFRQLVTR